MSESQYIVEVDCRYYAEDADGTAYLTASRAFAMRLSFTDAHRVARGQQGTVHIHAVRAGLEDDALVDRLLAGARSKTWRPIV